MCTTIWSGEYDQEDNFRTQIDQLVKEGESWPILNKSLDLTEIIDKAKPTLDKKLLQQWREEFETKGKWRKCPQLSCKLRQEGNEFYGKRNFPKALRGFTLSIMFAPGESSQLVLAYSNRSAAFMEMSNFDACLADIAKALEILDRDKKLDNELKSVRVKLQERKSRCDLKVKEVSTISTKEEGDGFDFSLKNPNKIIPSAEAFVTIKDNPQRGRHVAVTKNVEPGTVIILEEPFSKILVNQYRWEIQFCHHCFKDITEKSSIACNNCVFALYCGNQCLQNDSQIHEYECSLSPFLHSLKLKRLVLLAFRTLLKLGAENLVKIYKQKSAKETQNEILGFENGKYLSFSYNAIKSLIYHQNSLREEELREYSTDAILLIELLDKKTDFFSKCNLKNFAASLLLLHQLNFPCNAHSLNALQLPTRNASSDEIITASTMDYGAGAFALLSMINHSCDSNVTRVTLSNGVVAVVTIKFLKAGDEVLDNYGVHFALQEFHQRQKHLREYYNFDCNCIACKNKWPTISQLEKMDVRFVCESCWAGITDYSKKSAQDCIIDRMRSDCRKCKVKYDQAKLKSKLESECVDKFQAAYDILLQNRPAESIPLLKEALNYIQSNVFPPYITTNYAQETLKQALGLLAIKNY